MYRRPDLNLFLTVRETNGKRYWQKRQSLQWLNANILTGGTWHIGDLLILFDLIPFLGEGVFGGRAGLDEDIMLGEMMRVDLKDPDHQSGQIVVGEVGWNRSNSHFTPHLLHL